MRGYTGSVPLLIGVLVVGTVLAYACLQGILYLRRRMDASLRAATYTPAARAADADRTVRLWGGLVMVADVAAFPLCKDWVVYGVVPVQWVCVVGIALGGYMLVFPEKYRELRAKSRR